MFVNLINAAADTLAVLPADPAAYAYYLLLMSIGSLIALRLR